MMRRLDLLGTLLALPRVPRRTRDGLLAFQSDRLRRIVRHAYDAVPYYRRRFDAHGVRVADLRLPSDMRALPITVKADLRACPDADLVARGTDPARLITHVTSGTSG